MPQASLLLKRSKLFLLKIPLRASHCVAQHSAAPVKAHQPIRLPIKLRSRSRLCAWRRRVAAGALLSYSTFACQRECKFTMIRPPSRCLPRWPLCLFVCLLWFLQKHTTGSDVKNGSGSGSVCSGFHTNLFLGGQLPDSWATFLHLRLKSIWFTTVDFQSGSGGWGGVGGHGGGGGGDHF